MAAAKDKREAPMKVRVVRLRSPYPHPGSYSRGVEKTKLMSSVVSFFPEPR